MFQQLVGFVLLLILLAGCSRAPSGAADPEQSGSMMSTASTEQIHELITALQSRDPEIRGRAAGALSQLGEDATPAVPALTKALSDRSTEVRMAAVVALGNIGPAASPALDKLKKLQSNRSVGSVATEAIQKIEAAEAGGQP